MHQLLPVPLQSALMLMGSGPSGAGGPAGPVLIYSGGTVDPAGWTVSGGSLTYDGTNVYADPAITEIETTHDNDLDGTLDVSGLSILAALNCDTNNITALDVSSCAALITLYCQDNE